MRAERARIDNLMRTVVRARGRWSTILPRLGIATEFLRNRHGPCPLCSGKDRYRYDDRDGTGSYYCNQCGAGDGLLMVRKMNSWDYGTACREIDLIIGTGPPVPAPKRPDPSAARLAKCNQILSEATAPEVVERYLKSRGLSVMSDVLRGHPALTYFEDGQFLGRFPAVLAPVVAADSSLSTVHRIYVGDVPTKKKMMPVINNTAASAVRLFESVNALGVAEGVETAIAAHELFKVPTWACLSANGIETFNPPSNVTHLIIYGDNDRNFVGQKAAHVLAARLAGKITVEVKIPDTPGTDWLDVLNTRTTR